MAKYYLKIEAEQLRKGGMSINAITKTLGVSKGTVSRWCNEISLTKIQKDNLYIKANSARMRGRLMGVAKNKAYKQKSLWSAEQWAKTTLSNITQRDLLVAGIALYWAEGSKAPSTTGFIFVNSDPKMILFMFRWLQEILQVPLTDIVCQIHINQLHRYRIRDILKFWSNLLSLPTDRFLPTYFAKSQQKKVYSNSENYFGMLRIGVRKSTLLKYKVLALIQQLKPA